MAVAQPGMVGPGGNEFGLALNNATSQAAQTATQGFNSLTSAIQDQQKQREIERQFDFNNVAREVSNLMANVYAGDFKGLTSEQDALLKRYSEMLAGKNGGSANDIYSQLKSRLPTMEEIYNEAQKRYGAGQIGIERQGVAPAPQGGSQQAGFTEQTNQTGGGVQTAPGVKPVDAPAATGSGEGISSQPAYQEQPTPDAQLVEKDKLLKLVSLLQVPANVTPAQAADPAVQAKVGQQMQATMDQFIQENSQPTAVAYAKQILATDSENITPQAKAVLEKIAAQEPQKSPQPSTTTISRLVPGKPGTDIVKEISASLANYTGEEPWKAIDPVLQKFGLPDGAIPKQADMVFDPATGRLKLSDSISAERKMQMDATAKRLGFAGAAELGQWRQQEIANATAKPPRPPGTAVVLDSSAFGYEGGNQVQPVGGSNTPATTAPGAGSSVAENVKYLADAVGIPDGITSVAISGKEKLSAGAPTSALTQPEQRALTAVNQQAYKYVATNKMSPEEIAKAKANGLNPDMMIKLMNDSLNTPTEQQDAFTRAFTSLPAEQRRASDRAWQATQHNMGISEAQLGLDREKVAQGWSALGLQAYQMELSKAVEAAVADDPIRLEAYKSAKAELQQAMDEMYKKYPNDPARAIQEFNALVSTQDRLQAAQNTKTALEGQATGLGQQAIKQLPAGFMLGDLFTNFGGAVNRVLNSGKPVTASDFYVTNPRSTWKSPSAEEQSKADAGANDFLDKQGVR